MAFPKFENDERASWSVVDATPITSVCNAAGYTISIFPSFPADAAQITPLWFV
jgi:hypothetical protein